MKFQSMQLMGNSRGRAVYEALIPEDFRRPQTDSQLEQFIRLINIILIYLVFARILNKAIFLKSFFCLK